MPPQPQRQESLTAPLLLMVPPFWLSFFLSPVLLPPLPLPLPLFLYLPLPSPDSLPLKVLTDFFIPLYILSTPPVHSFLPAIG